MDNPYLFLASLVRSYMFFLFTYTDGDVKTPNCSIEAIKLVDDIRNFSRLLLEHSIEVNLNTTSLCQ